MQFLLCLSRNRSSASQCQIPTESQLLSNYKCLVCIPKDFFRVPLFTSAQTLFINLKVYVLFPFPTISILFHLGIFHVSASLFGMVSGGWAGVFCKSRGQSYCHHAVLCESSGLGEHFFFVAAAFSLCTFLLCSFFLSTFFCIIFLALLFFRFILWLATHRQQRL